MHSYDEKVLASVDKIICFSYETIPTGYYARLKFYKSYVSQSKIHIDKYGKICFSKFLHIQNCNFFNSRFHKHETLDQDCIIFNNLRYLCMVKTAQK